VFVTKYRRPVFTHATLTFAENTTDGVCVDLDAELVEFNGEADNVHLLLACPPTLAIATLDHQAIHRRPSPATLNAGLPPSTTRGGLTPD
jgi:REP element-mobilizing transposase RayT